MSTDRRQRDELLLLHSRDSNVDRSSTATDLLLGETRLAADYETTRAEHTYIYTARKLLLVYSLFFFPSGSALPRLELAKVPNAHWPAAICSQSASPFVVVLACMRAGEQTG